MSTPAENMATIRRYIENHFNKHDLNGIEQFVARDYINTRPGPQGIEGFKIVVGALLNGFPDVQNSIDDIFAEGDRVVTRWTASGTNTDSFMGIPATGKPVRVQGISIDRFDENGMWVEGWAEFDQLGMLQQMGIIPAPAQASA